MKLGDENGQTPYLTYCFSSVRPLSDRQYNDGDRSPSGELSEAVTLNFSKVVITFSGPFQTSDLTRGFDFSKNVLVTSGCPSGKDYNPGGGGGLRPNKR